jgi:hypothetical protein
MAVTAACRAALRAPSSERVATVLGRPGVWCYPIIVCAACQGLLAQTAAENGRTTPARSPRRRIDGVAAYSTWGGSMTRCSTFHQLACGVARTPVHDSRTDESSRRRYGIQRVVRKLCRRRSARAVAARACRCRAACGLAGAARDCGALCAVHAQLAADVGSVLWSPPDFARRLLNRNC